MVDYSIAFARSARKELESLSPRLVTRIMSRIESLSKDPRPPGCRKLRGVDNLWRIRVGEYRIIYSIDDRERLVDISTIGPRGSNLY
jgi:mRNA interferase RelE/StbE